jgi:hypothetical protein
VRRVEVWIPLDGKPEETSGLLRRSPATWLPEPADERGPGHWKVTLHAGPITRAATCGVGEATGDERNVRRRIIWNADPESAETSDRALPSFDGALILSSVGERRANLALEGTYEAPEGSIGASLGPSQIQSLAEAAAAKFLDDVATRILGDEPAEAEAQE